MGMVGLSWVPWVCIPVSWLREAIFFLIAEYGLSLMGVKGGNEMRRLILFKVRLWRGVACGICWRVGENEVGCPAMFTAVHGCATFGLGGEALAGPRLGVI